MPGFWQNVQLQRDAANLPSSGMTTFALYLMLLQRSVTVYSGLRVLITRNDSCH